MAGADREEVLKRAEVHIRDAVDNGREVRRHLDALDLYGVTALQCGGADMRATARGVLGQALDQVRFLTGDLTDVREAFEEVWG